MPDLPQAKGRSFGSQDSWPGAGPAPLAHARPSRISFQLHGPNGPVRCLAYNAGDAGRIDLRLPCDVSRIDRARLEAGVQALLDQLDRMALLD